MHHLKALLRQYGLAEAEYRSMLEAQSGKCGICHSDGRDASGQARTPYRFLCLDHSHRSGAVRGLLCDKCNLGIGNFDDDPIRLEQAAAYLRRYHDGVVDYII